MILFSKFKPANLFGLALAWGVFFAFLTLSRAVNAVCPSGPVFDKAVSIGVNAAAANMDITIDSAGVHRLLVVMVDIADANAAVTSATANGAPMSFLRRD